MIEEILRRFNGDVHTKEALIEFLHSFIDSVALERLYKGEDVSHIKDARKLIDSAFDELKQIYAVPTKPQEESSAR